MGKIKNMYAYLLVFVCIYIEFGYTTVVANYISGMIRSLILIGVVVPLFFFKSRQSKSSVFLIVYTLLIIMINSLKDGALGDYSLFLLPVIVGYLIATRLPFELCVKSFCDIVYYLTLYSLVLYFLCVLIPSFAGLLPFIGDFHDTMATMHDGFFAVVINGSRFPRNFGIAWEPGAFSILLCIAVFCSIYFFKIIDKKRILVYSVGIVTTFSTTGYVVLAILYISLSGMRRINTKGVVLLALVISIVTLQIPFMQELTFGKLDGILSSPDDVNETTEARINAIIYPAMAFFSQPITGVGYEKFKAINTIFCNGVATNTIINWFAIFGVLLGIPFTVYYVYAIRKILNTNVSMLYMLSIIIGSILMVSTESLLRISLIYVIIFLGTLKFQDIKIINNG